MKTKLNLNEGTIQKLQSLLEDLKADIGDPLPEIASVLRDASISWDKAIAAREKREPEDFFCIFKDYHQRQNIEWYPVCHNLDIELLASLIAHEARKVTHWDENYNSSYYPFFIAGLERLINYQ